MTGNEASTLGAAGAGRVGGDVERDVVGWLRTELEDDAIDAADNFLEVGGHSMLAVQLNNWLTDRHGVSLPLPVLFQDAIRDAIAAAAPRR